MGKRSLALALSTFALGTDSFVTAGIVPEVAAALLTRAVAGVDAAMFSPAGAVIGGLGDRRWAMALVAALVGMLLATWGAAGTAANLGAGRVVDRIGPRTWRARCSRRSSPTWR